ncbi:hypothetical protein GCM10020331_034370 [Ectobacillus funiculus]
MLENDLRFNPMLIEIGKMERGGRILQTHPRVIQSVCGCVHYDLAMPQNMCLMRYPKKEIDVILNLTNQYLIKEDDYEYILE